MQPEPETLVGRSLGGYHLDRILGRGGMSAVFLSHAVSDPLHIVAVKVLLD